MLIIEGNEERKREERMREQSTLLSCANQVFSLVDENVARLKICVMYCCDRLARCEY